jgi:trehalose 6-phosphate phosphatase
MPQQEADPNRAPVPRPPSPKHLDGGRDALFLDFDGTLVEIAPTPDSVRPVEGLTDLLRSLEDALGGAMAIVSGRKLDDIDHFLAPLRPTAAALHGRDRRLPDGSRQRLDSPVEALATARRTFDRFVRAHPGTALEDKGESLALHYRGAAEAGEAARAAAGHAVEAADGALLAVPGKMVVELLPVGEDKGTAVEAFMTIAPFAGRVPIFIGDDVTDEAGFAAASRLGGLGIRIGDRTGPTAATASLPDVPALHRWLESAIKPRATSR